MIKYYKTENSRIHQIDECEHNCWINVVSPDEDEIDSLIKRFNLEPDFIRAALDEEESSRIENEDGTTLIIIDIPYVDKKGGNIVYSTMPIGIIVTKENVITVSFRENMILSEFAQGVVRNVNTEYKTQFVLYIILRVSSRYLQYLKQIDQMSNYLEHELRISMKNKELIGLLDINKSLVYFSTSLKADEITLEKMMRGRLIRLYEEDQDLLEDVLIEIRQAIEMSGIYSNVLSGTMDAFASVISNNLNIVMKALAGITIVISVPTIISGLYGMNIINGIPGDKVWWIPTLITLGGMAAAAYFLKKKDML
ncbi:MAG: magnesium transporter CorA family protein [Oscillospiraceae bacterium]|jgi:magnesium transporter|nr:magnesium transporter CorA family protein [Oscillospiraceae bacterium]